MDGRPIEVRVGAGVVELLGNDFASLLYLRGEPARLHAYDCRGSVAQLAARSTWETVRPDELDALRDWLADPGLRVDRRSGAVRGLLVEPLEPFTRLLAPGRYVVSATAAPWAETVVVDPGEHGVRSWYWPVEGAAIVPTSPWPPPDRATVAAYRDRIAKGVRPAAVAIGPAGRDVRYLLDGHHKLAAYQAERVRPLIIELAPEAVSPLPRELFAGLLPEHVRERFSHTFDDWRHGGPPPDGLNQP
ncbi:hypothetical protein [Plantactinospora soyae]|uniref:Uncharacterized protein n=1 Tax=Plantactinospora soyae TaxID=1544732 RepID=A0A927M225_9ACTN|nr:hypothetical protein [Plantactinospora soyae]MBE1485321.1 hypothetical protein [Plantactinospora soyae]